MTLSPTKDVPSAGPRPHDAERPESGLPPRRRSATANGYATELRTLLPPDERWMVAAYGE